VASAMRGEAPAASPKPSTLAWYGPWHRPSCTRPTHPQILSSESVACVGEGDRRRGHSAEVPGIARRGGRGIRRPVAVTTAAAATIYRL